MSDKLVEDFAIEATAKALVQIRMSGMSAEAKKELAEKVFLKYGLARRVGPHIVGGFRTFEDHVKFVDGLKRKRQRENRLIKSVIEREITKQLPGFMERIMKHMLESWEVYIDARFSRVLGSTYRKRFNNGDGT